ncbi:PulJ/GspJ family protein [Thermomonas carbonis]|uniref:Type II secretion system protein n=1 Tax=Thermomonas carbonis TaxID=1463158 RepID=A0A7G9SU65_9GAMM|nr:type II secretion system protein [Thermomonas carbonis]QNN71390.1 type II secretion system protein [Thermomonas carbonis]
MAGFTLLEAIVALVILSIGALALYGWLSTNMIALERVRARQEQEIVARSSLDLVRRLNPMETPTGERRVDDLIVKWSGRCWKDPSRVSCNPEVRASSMWDCICWMFA